MEYRKLGATGVDVSAICLGTMGFGGRDGPTHPWALSEEESEPFFRLAIERGVNFFDTADHYNHGASERTVGRWLAKYARRDEIVVATKVGLEMAEGPNGKGLSKKRIVQGIDASLRRLDMDYVDLFYIHRLDDTPFEVIVDAFDEVVRAGKALHPAASSMYAWQFAKLREMQRARGHAPFAAMQNLLNLLYREEEREMIPYCVEEGVAVVPWSPIARGFLAGNKPREGEGERTRRAQIDKSGSLFGREQDYATLERVRAVAGELGTSPAKVAYAWVMQSPGVTAPIVGATKLPQLEEAIDAVDLDLPADAVAQLEEGYRPREPTGFARPTPKG